MSWRKEVEITFLEGKGQHALLGYLSQPEEVKQLS